jgi:Spy/CpxP family protein refolding chaperone
MTKSKWILSALLALCLAAPFWAASRTAGGAATVDAAAAGGVLEADEHGLFEPAVDAELALDDDEAGGRDLRDRRPGLRRGPGFGGRHGHHRGFGMRGTHRGDGIGGLAFRGLDLSEAQRKEIDEIRERQQRRAITARAELQEAALDLRKLMRDDRPDRGAIESEIDKIAELRGSLMKSRINARLEAMSVLTEEQRDQLRERRMKGPQRGSERDGRGSAEKSDSES